MPTPTADTYTAASGATLQGGRGIAPGALPAWRQAMAPFTWAAVPFSNTLASQNPELDASINPSAPGPSAIWHGTNGHQSIVNNWAGMVASHADGRVFLPLGGGHYDWHGNEAYSADLMAAAPTWQRISDPSGSTGMPVISPSDGQEASGVYADGRIRSIHGYNNAIFIPTTGNIFLSAVAAPSVNPAVAAVQKSFWIDPDDGAHSLASDFTALALVQGLGDGAGCCYDPVRNVVWHIRNANGSGARMLKTDVASGVTTAHGVQNTWVDGYSRFIYIPGLDLVVNLTGNPGRLLIWNPATELWVEKLMTGTKSAGMNGLRLCGADWDAGLGAIVIWGQSSLTTEMTLLTPPALPLSSNWTFSVLPPASGSVTPTVMSPQGTFTKFARHPVLGGFYLLNAYADPMYFFATE